MEARAIATATYEMNAALQKSCLTTYCALNIRCSRYRSCFHQLRITLNNKFKWDSPGELSGQESENIQRVVIRTKLVCLVLLLSAYCAATLLRARFRPQASGSRPM